MKTTNQQILMKCRLSDFRTAMAISDLEELQEAEKACRNCDLPDRAELLAREIKKRSSK